MTRSMYLAILLALFEVGFCMKCYQCTSTSDRGCGMPFKAKDKVVDCNDEASMKFSKENTERIAPKLEQVGKHKFCHKIIMANHKIIRTCMSGWIEAIEMTCDQMKHYHEAAPPKYRIRACHVCKTDLCNAAGFLIFPFPQAVFLFLATYVL